MWKSRRAVAAAVVVTMAVVAAGVWRLSGMRADEGGTGAEVERDAFTPAPGSFAERAMAMKDGPKAIPSAWFTLQRAWPGTEIPYQRVRAAQAQARALQAESAIAGTGGAWTAAGPDNVGGRITAIAVHPSNPDLVLAGGAVGGVLRSTDGGNSWTPVTDYLASLSVGAVASDPQDSLTFWLGTGEANSSGDSYAGDGVYKSTDGGSNWAWSGLPDSRHIGRIAVDPLDSDVIYVAAMGSLFGTNPERGLYKSTDGGASWSRKLFVNDSTGCVDVVVHPTKPDTLFAAMWERIRRPDDRRVGGLGSGLYRSRDGGETWTLLGGGLPGPALDRGRIGVHLSPANPEIVYAIYIDDPGDFDGVYKSTNGGDTWTATGSGGLSGLTGGFGWYFGTIYVHPLDAERVYVFGLDVYRSTNGGANWSKISWGIHVDQHAFWADPNDIDHLMVGNDGGAFYTYTGKNPWTKCPELPVTQFYAGTIDQQNPARIAGGTQDNSTVRTLGGAVNDWDVIYGGDGFYTLIDPIDSNVIYAEYQYGGLGKSVDNGENFDDATFGIDPDDRRNWNTPVVMDPSDHQTLYYGAYRMYRSTDGAGSWSAISADLTDGPGSGSLTFGTITTIAVSPSNPDVVYAGCDDGNVWVTQNGGSSWTSIRAGLPDRWVTRVAVDPSDDALCYVTLSGYSVESLLPHVFRSTNHGATWTDISGNLPEGPVNVVVPDPDDNSRLYVGTDFGVFTTDDAGATWSALGTEFPVCTVFDMKLHQPSRQLVAYTHGRSAFRYDLAQLTDVAAGEGTGAGGLPPRGAGVSLAAAPNPFREGTALSFRLAEAGRVNLAIYDVRGRLVRSVHDGAMTAGEHSLAWDGRADDGRRAATGTYFVRLVTPAGKTMREVTLLH